MFTKISPKTIKHLPCSSNLDTDDLHRTSFEVLKVTDCPSVDDFLNFITSPKFHNHFHHAKCAFVIVAECEGESQVRRLSEDELKELSEWYRDKKLMVVSIEGKITECENGHLKDQNIVNGKSEAMSENKHETAEISRGIASKNEVLFESDQNFSKISDKISMDLHKGEIETKSDQEAENHEASKSEATSKNSSFKSNIYYKQLHESTFKILGDPTDESSFNFSSFLLSLNTKNFGTFNGKLLETQIDTTTCYNGKRLIDYAVESNKILSVRFLQLFNFDLKVMNEEDERPLEIAAKLPTMDAFIALLKFKFEFWNDELCKCDYNVLHLRNKNGLTLLMLAALSGNTGVVSLLVKIGVDKNYEVRGETAASLAWKNKKFEALLVLLKFDARYPRDFKNELEERWEEVPKELKKFVGTIEAFHLSVSRNESAECEKILQTFPNVFHFYNTQNQSAALTALKNDAWNYEELIKLGIYVGFHEKFEGFVTTDEKDNKHLSGKNLITLMSKSYVGYSTSYEEKKRKVAHILRCYSLLYQIEQVRPILTIVVSHPIKIIFDFSRLSVQHLHPEASDYTSGSLYHSKGYIFIGAKNLLDSKKDSEVFATLGHKLLHYALQIIYDNDSKPYFEHDEDRRLEFEEICKICEQLKSFESIIENVYEYNVNEQHAELISRIPHLLALYFHNEDKRKFCHEKFKKLFTFYERRILHDLRMPHVEDLKIKNEIYKLNAKLQVVQVLKASPYKLKCESLKVNAVIKDKSIIYVSNSPALTAQAVYQRHKIESFHIGSSSSLQSQKSDQIFHHQRLFLYMTHDKVDENGTLQLIKMIMKALEAFDSRLSLTIIMNCEDKSIKILKSIAKKFHPYKLAFIVEVSSNTINRDVLSRTFDLRDVKYTYNDLTQQTQQMLLEINMNFQGIEMKLKEFLPPDKSQNSLKELPLNSLITSNGQLKISSKIENDTKYYVRRQFIDSTARCNRWDQERNEYVDEYDKPVKTFDEIAGTEATKVILLADEPKAGKTSTFKSIATRLKSKFTDKWIVFIDHKHHADVYRTCKSIEWNQQKLAMFISQDVLQLSTEFERKIFEEFFVDGRVIVLLEMNVFYQEILDFAVRIKELSQNQLWISSWPQHAVKLEAAFKTKSFKLVPFDDENRREFFEKFLKSKGICEQEEVDTRISELEGFLQLHNKEDNFPCDIPLMLRMIAEVYENSLADQSLKFSSNNLFSIYQAFIQRILGPLASNSRLNIMQLHQKYALKEVFCRKKKNECEEIVKALQIMTPRVGTNNNTKKIFTCGIMYKLERAKLKFIHKTFADFFVAQYIIDNVLNMNMGGNNNGTEAELRSKLFLNIIRDSNRCHKTIHRFLDNYIEMNESELEERFDESCYTFLSGFKPPQYFRSLLWRLARHRCFYLIKFLTELYMDDSKLLREMWGVISFDGYSFLFKTIDKEDGEIDFTFTQRVWELAKEVFNDRCDLISILKTTLVRSSCSVFKNVFPNFWQFAEDFLTADEKIEILTKNALELFARNKTKKFFVEVCEIAERSLNAEQMKMFLMSCDEDGRNFLYHFSKTADDEALQEVLKKFKQYLSLEDQKHVLTKRIRSLLEEDKKTPPKSLRILWEFAEQQLDKEELKSLLLTTNSSHFTIFHETILEGDEKTFNFMVEVHERILEKDEIKALLMQTFQSNKTLLYKSMGVSIDSILMVWDYLQDVLDDDEETLKKFLAHRDDFGDTAFSSMKWYDAFPNELFMPFISENFTKIEIERLFEKNSEENSVVTDVISVNTHHEQNDVIEANETPKQHKHFSLNCFCCAKRV